MAWQAATAAKQAELWQHVDPTWRLTDTAVSIAQDTPGSMVSTVHAALSPAEQDITARPTANLLAAIASGDFSAKEVLEAFSHRAILAHQLVRLTLAKASFSAVRNSLLARDTRDIQHVFNVVAWNHTIHLI